MKLLVFFFLFCCLLTPAYAQGIKGKWYGYALQGPGELCTTCDFELDLSQGKGFWGQSYRKIEKEVEIRFSIYGAVDKTDSLRLDENKDWLITSINPPSWQACVNHYNLKYHKIGNSEYLLGNATGYGIDDGEKCVPGIMIFARTKTDLASYFALHKDSLDALVTPAKQAALAERPLAAFTSGFDHTTINKITELQVEHTDLEIRLRDYLREDNDTVSIYLNRELLAAKKKIAHDPFSVKFSIRKGLLNELLLFAENLGEIPPNTSEMYLIDGRKSYRILIESDKQKTAAVYLRYKP